MDDRNEVRLPELCRKVSTRAGRLRRIPATLEISPNVIADSDRDFGDA
jgi:hypothetical protein